MLFPLWHWIANVLELSTHWNFELTDDMAPRMSVRGQYY